MSGRHIQKVCDGMAMMRGWPHCACATRQKSAGHTTHAADTARSPVLAIAVPSERWRVGRDGRGVMPGVMTTTRMTSPELVG